MVSNKKKFKSLSVIIFITLLFIFFAQTLIFANNNNPSSWAAEEVEKALSLGFIPNELAKDYTTPIKRNEYTVLATNLYKKTGNNILIEKSDVFTDIEGDTYQKELMEAYSARIVDGYPDGSFKPQNNISRQEISKLLYNLVVQLKPEEAKKESVEFVYKDISRIGSWAKPYVDYCYENEIIKGIAELTINPTGNATREQAIIMLYRLAKNKELLEKNLPFEVEDDSITESSDISDVVSLVDVLFYIKEPGYYSILQSSEEKLIIRSNSNVYYFNITKANEKLKIIAETNNPSDEEFLYLIENLLKMSEYKEEAKKLFMENLQIAVENKEMFFGQEKQDKYLINGYTINDIEDKTYILMYEEK